MKKRFVIAVPALALWLGLGVVLMAAKGSKSFAQGQALPTIAGGAPAADAPWPTSAKIRWGQEPVQARSSKRAQVDLNGAWSMMAYEI